MKAVDNEPRPVCISQHQRFEAQAAARALGLRPSEARPHLREARHHLALTWNQLRWRQSDPKGRGAFAAGQRPTLSKQHATKNSGQSLRLLTKASGCRNMSRCQLRRAAAQI